MNLPILNVGSRLTSSKFKFMNEQNKKTTVKIEVIPERPSESKKNDKAVSIDESYNSEYEYYSESEGNE